MSSQKQCKRVRAMEKNMELRISKLVRQNVRFSGRIMWLERRPPWWRPWAVRKWREEEPV